MVSTRCVLRTALVQEARVKQRALHGRLSTVFISGTMYVRVCADDCSEQLAVSTRADYMCASWRPCVVPCMPRASTVLLEHGWLLWQMHVCHFERLHLRRLG
jgi:hypothetical protein